MNDPVNLKQFLKNIGIPLDHIKTFRKRCRLPIFKNLNKLYIISSNLKFKNKKRLPKIIKHSYYRMVFSQMIISYFNSKKAWANNWKILIRNSIIKIYFLIKEEALAEYKTKSSWIFLNQNIHT